MRIERGAIKKGQPEDGKRAKDSETEEGKTTEQKRDRGHRDAKSMRQIEMAEQKERERDMRREQIAKARSERGSSSSENGVHRDR